MLLPPVVDRTPLIARAKLLDDHAASNLSVRCKKQLKSIVKFLNICMGTFDELLSRVDLPHFDADIDATANQRKSV